MSESPSEPRAKRQRVDKNGRFAAMERLRQLKGTKNKCQVEDQVDDVYDVVDEREYAKRAQEKYGDDWIEEDGTGYAEDLRDFFEDEDEYSDGEEEQKDFKKKKGVAPNSKKRPRETEKPVTGKASIKNLFSNAVPKKIDVKNSVKDDDILADILGEIKEEPAATSEKTEKVIAPAKISVTSRKFDAAAAKEYMNSFLNNIKVQEQERKKAEASSDNEMLERILKPKAAVPNTKVAFFSSPTIKKEPAPEKTPAKTATEDAFSDNEMDFSCLDDDENQFDVEKTQFKEKISQTKASAEESSQAKVDGNASPKKETECSAKESASESEDISRLLNNWESICQMDDDFEKSYLASVRNQLQLSMRRYVQRFYKNWLVCDHPDCNFNTRTHSLRKKSHRPLCQKCRSGSLLRQYTERDLYNQLCYLRFMFDLGKQTLHQKPTLTPELEQAYQLLYETVDQQLQSSSYVIISLSKLFARSLAQMSLQPPVAQQQNESIPSALADVV
ncbi:uncharacterized protein Dyak_GE11060 [Drosophila yakuba]|uniref:Uncharacterized protein n=1 Tax=Drosophila yakuba TaxID=7245 RepID=B4IV29_DROYA|nr:uncharacterized protein Dyak_GE11060 [Drosophila yakuba]